MDPLELLFDGVRSPAGKLLVAARDPHAELLAMIWGPQFDREHARQLARRQLPLQNDVLLALMAAADRFDQLPATRQHWLRRMVLRHRGNGTIGHAPHPAD